VKGGGEAAMEIGVERRGEVTVLHPRGELKVGGPDLVLRAAFDRAIEQGSRRIVLDLGEVHFVDSSGLGEMVAALKKLRAGHGDLKLAAANRRVTETLRITQLVRVLEIHPDAAGAVAAFH
jgi:anti-sigma B factor antagonist